MNGPPVGRWPFFVLTVNEIISELYVDARINQCIRNFAAESPEDVKQDLFSALLTKDSQLIIKLHAEGTLYYYAIGIARNLTRKERRRVKTEAITDNIFDEHHEDIDTSALIEEIKRMDTKADTFYFTELIKAIAQHGSQGAVAKITGIPKQSISVQVREVRRHLKKSLCY
jgi:DNA-directed RNA polymerase specialized sigma24 family protein